MSRTKLVPEVFLDIFLYKRESRERRESGLPIRSSLRHKKIKRNLGDQVVSNLTRDLNLTRART